MIMKSANTSLYLLSAILILLSASTIQAGMTELPSHDTTWTKVKNYISRPFMPYLQRYLEKTSSPSIHQYFKGMKYSNAPAKHELTYSELRDLLAQEKIKTPNGLPAEEKIKRIVVKQSKVENVPNKLYIYTGESDGDTKTTYHFLNGKKKITKLVDVKQKVLIKKTPTKEYQMVYKKDRHGNYVEDHIITKEKHRAGIFGEHQFQVKLKSPVSILNKYSAYEVAKVKGPFGLRYRPLEDGKRIAFAYDPNAEAKPLPLGTPVLGSRALNHDKDKNKKEKSPEFAYYMLANEDDVATRQGLQDFAQGKREKKRDLKNVLPFDN